MNPIVIKKLKKQDYDEAMTLVWQVFKEYEGVDYTQQGIDEFYTSIHSEVFLAMLTIYGAFFGEKLVGVIATRNELSHIALFFVDSTYQKQGIGRKLFQRVLEYSSTKRFTVNASPYAVAIYHKLGFRDTDQEQTVNGLRFTPMVYK